MICVWHVMVCKIEWHVWLWHSTVFIETSGSKYVVIIGLRSMCFSLWNHHWLLGSCIGISMIPAHIGWGWWSTEHSWRWSKTRSRAGADKVRGCNRQRTQCCNRQEIFNVIPINTLICFDHFCTHTSFCLFPIKWMW